jgi:hypothetical protein
MSSGLFLSSQDNDTCRQVKVYYMSERPSDKSSESLPSKFILPTYYVLKSHRHRWYLPVYNQIEPKNPVLSIVPFSVSLLNVKFSLLSRPLKESYLISPSSVFSFVQADNCWFFVQRVLSSLNLHIKKQKPRKSGTCMTLCLKSYFVFFVRLGSRTSIGTVT